MGVAYVRLGVRVKHPVTHLTHLCKSLVEQRLRATGKKTNIAKGNKGWEIGENHDHPRPEGTSYIKEEKVNSGSI